MTSGIDVVITPEAERDVREILAYTLAEWGREQRNAYFVVLKQAVRRLQRFPEMGRMIGSGIRELPVSHHVILYRYEKDAITILRVMHPRRLRR